jgi:hypothetical protein
MELLATHYTRSLLVLVSAVVVVASAPCRINKNKCSNSVKSLLDLPSWLSKWLLFRQSLRVQQRKRNKKCSSLLLSNRGHKEKPNLSSMLHRIGVLPGWVSMAVTRKIIIFSLLSHISLDALHQLLLKGHQVDFKEKVKKLFETQLSLANL